MVTQTNQKHSPSQSAGSDESQVVSNSTPKAYPPTDPPGDPQPESSRLLVWFFNPLDYCIAVWGVYLLEVEMLICDHDIVPYQAWNECRERWWARMQRIRAEGTNHFDSSLFDAIEQRANAECYRLGWNPGSESLMQRIRDFLMFCGFPDQSAVPPFAAIRGITEAEFFESMDGQRWLSDWVKRQHQQLDGARDLHSELVALFSSHGIVLTRELLSQQHVLCREMQGIVPEGRLLTIAAEIRGDVQSSQEPSDNVSPEYSVDNNLVNSDSTPDFLSEREVVRQWPQVANWTPQDRRQLTFLLGQGCDAKTLYDLRFRSVGELLDGYTEWLEGRRTGLLAHTPEGRSVLEQTTADQTHILRPIWMLLNLIGDGRDRPDQPSATAMTLDEAINVINSVRRICGTWAIIPITDEDLQYHPQNCIRTELESYRDTIGQTIAQIRAIRYMCDGRRPGNYSSTEPTVNSAAIEAHRLLEKANVIRDEAVRESGGLDMNRPDPNRPIPLNDDELLLFLRDLRDWSVTELKRLSASQPQTEQKDASERQAVGIVETQSQSAGHLGAVTDTTETDKPDGPFDRDGFRFRGVDVRFGRAANQYRLMLAFWDTEQGQIRSPQDVNDLIVAVYGEDHDTTDEAFRQLCSDTRRRLESSNIPLTIPKPACGKLQLQVL